MPRLVSFAVLALLVAPQSSSPTLDAVLGKAGQFVVDLQKVRVLAADEVYQQVYRVSGDADRAVSTATAPPLGEWSGHTPRKIRAQFILLSNADSDVGWLAFRDAFEVDGRKLRGDQGGLEPMFAQSFDAAFAAGQVLSAEAIKHNKGTMARAVHATTFALTVLGPSHQASFKFEKKGEKKVGDVVAWVVAYAEISGGKFARTIEGVPQPLRGEFWIDPATGRVLKSTVVMDSLDANPDMKQHPERYANFPRMTFEVTYALDAKLNLWLPRELKENYDRRVEVVTTTATYTNYRVVTVK
jgi:hypothetical protein